MFQVKSKPGQADVLSVALEQRTTAFAFQFLDRARQRGLRNATASGRTGETLLLAEREKVADLVCLHPHGRDYRAARSMARVIAGEEIATTIAST